MCQQHIREHTCGHQEILKPQFCPLSFMNGGHPCEPIDVVRRAAPDVCAACSEQASFAAGS